MYSTRQSISSDTRKSHLVGRSWRYGALGLMALFALLLGGCEFENPFETPYNPEKPKAMQTKRRLSINEKIMPFVYVPIKKRDPFRPPGLIQTTTRTSDSPKTASAVVRPQARRVPQTELEKFELDQITIVATVTGTANPIAMVEGPNGRGFVVRRGTSIGRNGGRVTRIYSSGIVISEVSRDNAGRRVVSRVMIRIKGDGKNKNEGDLRVGGRRLYIDDSGTPRYQSLKNRTDALFRRRGVGAQ